MRVESFETAKSLLLSRKRVGRGGKRKYIKKDITRERKEKNNYFRLKGIILHESRRKKGH
jgi:hypothetical protein